jgi:hypothetical protein
MATNDAFFQVKTKTFKSTKGNYELPIFYQDFGYAHFIFFADYESAARKLAETAFLPCRFFNGKAGVLLNFFEYRKSAIGPYNEVGLSILCHPKKQKPGLWLPQLMKDAKQWSIGAYVINLPVTTEIAYIGGVEVWNYPKFVTDITVELKGKSFKGMVADPQIKAPIFTLEGRMGLVGPGVRLSTASFISHTTHKGKPLRTLTEVDARFKANMGFSGALAVNEKSGHSMAKNLVDLGMQGKKPFGAIYAEKARMKLHEGVPIG